MNTHIHDAVAYRNGWDMAYKAGVIGLISIVLSLLSFLVIPGMLAGIGAVAALIMWLVALYRLSQGYNDPTLFRYSLWALIIGVVGGVVLGIGLVLAMGASAAVIESASEIQNEAIAEAGGIAMLTSMGIWAVLFLILFLASAILQALVYWRLGNYTDNVLFKIAAVLVFFGVGGILAYVGALVEGNQRRKESLPAT